MARPVTSTANPASVTVTPDVADGGPGRGLPRWCSRGPRRRSRSGRRRCRAGRGSDGHREQQRPIGLTETLVSPLAEREYNPRPPGLVSTRTDGGRQTAVRSPRPTDDLQWTYRAAPRRGGPVRPRARQQVASNHPSGLAFTSFAGPSALTRRQGHCVLGLLLVAAVMRSWGRRLARRVARAMLVSPLVWWYPIEVLRRVAMTAGPLPVRA